MTIKMVHSIATWWKFYKFSLKSVSVWLHYYVHNSVETPNISVASCCFYQFVKWLLRHMITIVTWHKLEKDLADLMTFVSIQGCLVLVDINDLHFPCKVTLSLIFLLILLHMLHVGIAYAVGCVWYQFGSQMCWGRRGWGSGIHIHLI